MFECYIDHKLGDGGAIGAMICNEISYRNTHGGVSYQVALPLMPQRYKFLQPVPLLHLTTGQLPFSTIC